VKRQVLGTPLALARNGKAIGGETGSHEPLSFDSPSFPSRCLAWFVVGSRSKD